MIKENMIYRVHCLGHITNLYSQFIKRTYLEIILWKVSRTGVAGAIYIHEWSFIVINDPLCTLPRFLLTQYAQLISHEKDYSHHIGEQDMKEST